MKRKYLLIIIYSLALSISCTKHNKTIESSESGRYVIDLDNIANNPDDSFVYSTFYKGIKTILLETNDSCLVGEIKKMQVYDQFIFILDKNIAKSLLVFDREGRFIRKIGGIGGGPGEYVEPTDFTLDTENRTIFVLDKHTKRINKYDLITGNFLYSINLQNSLNSEHVEIIGGKLYADAYFYMHSEDNYLLSCIHDPSGVEEANYLNVMKYNKGFSNKNINFGKVFHLLENGNAVFAQPFMDHIIEINSDSIFTLIDIKSKNVLTLENIEAGMEKQTFMSEIMRFDKYFFIMSFIEHKNQILFECMKGFNFIKILFNKDTHEVRIFKNIRDDLLISDEGTSGYPIPMVGCYYSDGVYYYVPQMSVPQIKECANNGIFSPNLDRLEDLKNLKEDANTILFYYEFK